MESELADLKAENERLRKVVQASEAAERNHVRTRKNLQDQNDSLRREVAELEALSIQQTAEMRALRRGFELAYQTYESSVEYLDTLAGKLDSITSANPALATTLTPVRDELFVLRMQVKKIQATATDYTVRRVQEKIFIEIVRAGGLTDELFVQVMDMAQNRQYFKEADHREELNRLLSSRRKS